MSERPKNQPTLPLTIESTTDDICSKSLYCKESGSPYRITKNELEIYRRLGVPIPDLCPNERHAKRQARRLPPTLFKRKCSTTGKDILTPYEPWRPEILDSGFEYV